MCEYVSCSACDLDGFGILVFGPQTRNLHPGGSERGFGEWRMAVQGGGGTAGGARMGCPSLSLLFVSCSPPSLCMCSAAPAVRLPTLSQSHTGRSLREHFCTTAQPGRLKPAGGHPGQRETEAEDPSGKRFICEFSSVSLMSDVHIRRDLCQIGK